MPDNCTPCTPCNPPHKFKYLHPIFWERVLPAVYDDTLTYYELISKLICKINEFVCLANKYGEIVINFEEIDEMIEELNERIDELNQSLPDIDEIPTDGSDHLVTSNGIFDFVMALTALLRQIDNTPTDGSNNLVTSDGVYDAIQAALSEAMGGYPDYGEGIINYLNFGVPRNLYFGTPYNARNGFAIGGAYMQASWNHAQTIVSLGGVYEFHINTELTDGSMYPRIPLYLDAAKTIPLNLPNNTGVENVYDGVGIVINWSANVKRDAALVHKANGNIEIQLTLPIYWAPTDYDIQGNRYQDCATFIAVPVFLATGENPELSMIRERSGNNERHLRV